MPSPSILRWRLRMAFPYRHSPRVRMLIRNTLRYLQSMKGNKQ